MDGCYDSDDGTLMATDDFPRNSPNVDHDSMVESNGLIVAESQSITGGYHSSIYQGIWNGQEVFSITVGINVQTHKDDTDDTAPWAANLGKTLFAYMKHPHADHNSRGMLYADIINGVFPASRPARARITLVMPLSGICLKAAGNWSPTIV
ncbi:hypothetical protein FRB91_004617 [Serendipita sp. 411]|nr:hypothetical protein FRB91_004617 [Serendipita sp. 411]